MGLMKKSLCCGVFVVLLANVANNDLGRCILALAAMRLFFFEEDVQVSCCALIAGYAYGNHAGKHLLYHLGGLRPPMDAMRRFPHHKRLQHTCANAVGGMSLFSFEICEFAGELGAVEMMVDVGRRWPEDPEMQIGGVHGCFMDFSQRNRARWSAAGGIELNLAAARAHKHHASAQFQLWCSFSSGTQDPNAEKYVELGGIELSIEVMKDHPTSYRVREEVMQSNRHPAHKHAYIRERLVSAGWIDAVITAMKEAPLDLHQQQPACNNLWALAKHNDTHRDMVVAAGAAELGLEAVKNAPRMFSPVQWQYDAQYTVYLDCIHLLNVLAKNSTAKEFLKAAQAAQHIQPVASAPQTPENARAEANSLLSALRG